MSDSEHLLREIYHIVHHEAHAWQAWRDRNRPLAPEDLEILDAILADLRRAGRRFGVIDRKTP